MIPGVDTVGGYSITSVPSSLPRLTLAVKASSHPPAYWCTERAREVSQPPADASLRRRGRGEAEVCCVACRCVLRAARRGAPLYAVQGDRVGLRVGGDFTLARALLHGHTVPDQDRLLFIAGGVGINPLCNWFISPPLMICGRMRESQ
jgi:hypothetical protein